MKNDIIGQGFQRTKYTTNARDSISQTCNSKMRSSIISLLVRPYIPYHTSIKSNQLFESYHLYQLFEFKHEVDYCFLLETYEEVHMSECDVKEKFCCALVLTITLDA